LKEILKDPSHKEYKEMNEWMGMEDREDIFDPNDFDLDYVNSLLVEI